MTLKRAGIMSSRSRDVLAEFDQKPVAAGAALVGEIDDDLLARQMFGQRAAIDLALAPDEAIPAGSRAATSASASAAAIAARLCPPASSASSVRIVAIFSDRGPKR